MSSQRRVASSGVGFAAVVLLVVIGNAPPAFLSASASPASKGARSPEDVKKAKKPKQPKKCNGQRLERRLECLPGGSSGAAKGDFDGDGFADLAVGVPEKNVGGLVSAGAVQVIYGSSTGLRPDRNQLWHQFSPGIEDSAEAGDEFGSAVAAGDFNADGLSDLAVGIPFEDVDSIREAGAVQVIYGSPSVGLHSSAVLPDQIFHQNTPDVEGGAEGDDRFGSSLAWANFGKSSHGDLAIGVPGEDREKTFGDAEDAGAVNVLYGSSAGLSAVGDQSFGEDTEGIEGSSATFDHFGFSLAAGNFGKSSHADLAVGVPFESVSGTKGGKVNVIYGSLNGLTASEDQAFNQGPFNQRESQPIEFGDKFGGALAAGNLGQTGEVDLVIGAPGEGVLDAQQIERDGAGEVDVLYARSGGLQTGGAQRIEGRRTPLEQDLFGFALAIGDFDGSGVVDLAIGAPDPVSGRGFVEVFYTTTSGLLLTGSQSFHQDVSGIEDAAESGDRFGSSLTAWNFGKTPPADLAIGVPGEDLTHGNQGAVNVLYGGGGRGGVLSATGSQFLHQDVPGMQGVGQPGDSFGRALY
jgi:hypothetical protein